MAGYRHRDCHRWTLSDSPVRLVLFDIDGTILRSGGVGRIAMERALTHVFGSSGSADYHYDGKTDKQIVRETMKQEGLTDEEIDERMPELLEVYLTGLNYELASGNR